jgi:hypothetical protein
VIGFPCSSTPNPAATAGMVFATLELAAEVLIASTGSPQLAADALRASLGDLTNNAIERGDDV